MDCRFDVVTVDLEQAIHTLLTYLLDLGHTNYIGGNDADGNREAFEDDMNDIEMKESAGGGV
ncbi:hypothetical protein [Numidum massiliense]|uniref:hypothetical protein n=1 Tax=Numidum massiliense TaxID=1522315 RepID=UPI0006D54BFA|nr:hypothetical protein [Numidum massiliense]